MSKSASYCTKEKKPCVDWVEKYFKDCLCNLNDDFSFGFGFISLICWGIAEIPQIVTNFRTKSSHGVSLLFLLTWIVGDAFNLVGCLLEPATLPTQFYTALLYTASTVILVLQSVYYDYVCRWLKTRHTQESQAAHDEKEHLVPKSAKESNNRVQTVPMKVSPRKEFFFTSARSLAGSSTPPFRSYYMRPIRSGPPAFAIGSDSSSEDEATSSVPEKSVTKPKPIPRSVGYGAFLATAADMPRQSNALMQVAVGFTARKLLHLCDFNYIFSCSKLNESGTAGGESTFGQWLGWLMAAIYMGGRIPQIWLNIKRGSVEGLNPLMFMFALIANLAYVASILTRTMEWDKIKPNLSWLLDAAVCVVLDFFIIMQYIYYKYQRKVRVSDYQEEYGETK